MSSPLLDHELDSRSAFTPEALVEAVRETRRVRRGPIPEVCILEFDGDLTDWLVSTASAKVCDSWACFHTMMYSFALNGTRYGVVPRTIGGPFAVLIAEQMAVSGARLVVGLTSAGRVSKSMPVPGLVVATSALRDEGTSYHYLAPAPKVSAPSNVATFLRSELKTQSLPVLAGTVWTTDAPYRETPEQLARHGRAGVLAVEMQAASLFAFSKARRFPVGLVAYVTNSTGQKEKRFEKGSRRTEFEVLRRVCAGGKKFLSSTKK